MRLLQPLLLAATAAASAALAAPTPVDPPQRLPGLWLMSTAPAGQAAQPSTFHICVGKTDTDVLNHPGNLLANCRDQAWSRDDHYRYYRATCDAKGSIATIEARIAGDLQYNYQGELTTRYSPPLDGSDQARAEILGRRLGPCRGVPEGRILIKGQDGIGNLNLGETSKGSAR